jgi:squalene-associated FAD-dependent desaturase
VDPHTGDVLDNGQHLLMGCYRSTLHYMQSIGTLHLVERRAQLNLPYAIAGEPRIKRLSLPAILPPPLNLLAGLWRTDLLTLTEKLEATRFGDRVRRNALPPRYNEQSCHELFEVTGQSDGLVRKLWEPIILATINASTREASAVLFVNVLRELFFTTRDASSLLIPRVGLTDLLIDPATEALTGSGVAIRFGEPVRTLGRNQDKWTVDTEAASYRFDRVVHAATDWSFLPASLRDSYRPQHSPILNAYFWLDKRVLHDPIHAFVGTRLQWAFAKETRFETSGVEARQRLALTVSAANEVIALPSEQLVTQLWDEIQSSLPLARDAKLLHSRIIKEKHATPLITAEQQLARPATVTAYSGLFMAGDLVQNGLPATIEGAIRNGYAAADACRNAGIAGL